MPNHRRRQQTADILAVLAEAVNSVSEATPQGKRRKARNGRIRKTRAQPPRAVPPEVLATILHNPTLDAEDQASARLVCSYWRGAHDSLVASLTCHTRPSHLPSRFPLLRRLDISFVDRVDYQDPPGADCTLLEGVLRNLAPGLPFLQRLVVTYRQLVGRDVALGHDRVELVQVGFRSHPARTIDSLAALLHPLTQLQDLLVYSHEDRNYPCTLAIYHRYPHSALPFPHAAPPASTTPPSAPSASTSAAPTPPLAPQDDSSDAPGRAAAAAAAVAASVAPAQGGTGGGGAATPGGLGGSGGGGLRAGRARSRRGKRARLELAALEAGEVDGGATVGQAAAGAGALLVNKWLSHLGVLLPPRIGCYAASCIHLHTGPQCQDYIIAEDLLHAPLPALQAVPPAAWQASRGWCTLRVLDLNFCTLTSWPPEWTALPLLEFFNISPYNVTGHLPLPNLALPLAAPLHSLALRGISSTPLLPTLALVPTLQSLTISYSLLTALPESLSTLTALTCLCLADNRLSNDVEPILEALTGLQDLDLSGNRLTSFPPAIASLTALTRLKIVDCSTWDAEAGLLGQLTNLQVLDLGGDRMAELPADITRLCNLHALNLRSVSLVTLPADFGALTALKTLDLLCNWLTTLPPSFSSLQSLTALDLGHNFLEELPPALLQLTSLSILTLAYNRLSTLPDEVSRLVHLASLDISFNPMRTLPPVLARCPSLETLIAQGLAAPPPFFLSSASNLMALDFTADGLDLRWVQAVPPSDFQEVVADPLLDLARRTPRATILADKDFVMRLRQAWVRAGAQPPFPKMAQIAWDAVELWDSSH